MTILRPCAPGSCPMAWTRVPAAIAIPMAHAARASLTAANPVPAVLVRVALVLPVAQAPAGARAVRALTANAAPAAARVSAARAAKAASAPVKRAHSARPSRMGIRAMRRISPPTMHMAAASIRMGQAPTTAARVAHAPLAAIGPATAPSLAAIDPATAHAARARPAAIAARAAPAVADSPTRQGHRTVPLSLARQPATRPHSSHHACPDGGALSGAMVPGANSGPVTTCHSAFPAACSCVRSASLQDGSTSILRMQIAWLRPLALAR